jgi:type II secretory ATPase GspE/PulE/Tfp pilus assembly ATPase PilB-like protein
MFSASQKGLDEELAKQRHVAEEKDAERRAARAGLPYLDLIASKIPVNLKALRLMKEADAHDALVAPFEISKQKLLVATFDPLTPSAKEALEKLKATPGVTLEIFVVSLTSLNYAWSYYQYVTEVKEISGSVSIDPAHLEDLIDRIKSIADLSAEIEEHINEYTSQMLEIVLAGGLTLGASDIHLEAGETKNTFRLRLDGILHTAYDAFETHTYHSVVTRIKLLSGLKLNIHREAQDGRFTIKASGKAIEVRTSVIPSEYGETVVMRLLDPSSLKANLEELGWRKDLLEVARHEIAQPNGLILNTGPTGSGKTTTLYAFLSHVKNPEIKIITVEDPIEYHLEGISQTQVDEEANYTFANGLRSILRQDPDVVLVGEIRDKDTAETALNASLTGHLVFSTLHTNDAIGAIPRMLNLGAEAQILAPGLRLVIAQRLVRVLCKECRKPLELSEPQKEVIRKFVESLPANVDKSEYANIEIYEPVGCDACQGIGYKGRTSIFELFRVTEPIQRLIYTRPTEFDLKDAARKEGLVFLQEDGVLKMLRGVTSRAEVEDVTGSIDWWVK